jgi:hypothetical protein
MKKHVMLVVSMLVLLVGLNGCCTLVPGKIVYSDDFTGTIDELKDRGVDVKVTILVSDTGQLLFYDTAGKRLNQCVLPKPDTQSKTDKKQASSDRTSTGVCRGLTKGSAVTMIQALPVIRTNSGTCMTFGPDASGRAYEYCF